MTREEKQKAVDALKISAPVIAMTQEEFNDYIQTLNQVMNWLEQEPRTVLYSGDGYADGYMVYDMAECPNCGYEYEDGDKDWGLSFCPNCGQKLNWERSDHKCHTCKHYTSGQRDGSCGSYICKHYSGWESEAQE